MNGDAKDITPSIAKTKDTRTRSAHVDDLRGKDVEIGPASIRPAL